MNVPLLLRVSFPVSYVFDLEMKVRVKEVSKNGIERVTLPSHSALQDIQETETSTDLQS